MDSAVWSDPNSFRVERWLEQPDAPLFTYGLGYRMCAGSLLANRELYLVFMRMLNAFEILKVDDVDCHPVRGNADPTSLVSMPRRYKRSLRRGMRRLLRRRLMVSKLLIPVRTFYFSGMEVLMSFKTSPFCFQQLSAIFVHYCRILVSRRVGEEAQLFSPPLIIDRLRNDWFKVRRGTERASPRQPIVIAQISRGRSRCN